MFEGLSEFSAEDGRGAELAGKYKGSLEELLEVVDLYEMSNEIEIHRGLIEQTLPELLDRRPELTFSFVYRDTDLYTSTAQILALVPQRMAPGAVLAFDEWNTEAWPGEGLAVNEFREQKPESFDVVRSRTRGNRGWCCGSADVDATTQDKLREIFTFVLDLPSEADLIGVRRIAVDGERYCAALGIGPMTEPVVDPEQRVAVAFVELAPGVLVELVEPAAEPCPIDSVLARGGGLYHVCYEVDDIGAAIGGVEAQGGMLISGPVPASAFEGRSIAFCFIGGNVIEFLAGSPGRP